MMLARVRDAETDQVAWLRFSDYAAAATFAQAADNLGYKILNLGSVEPGWGGIGPTEIPFNYGYVVPFHEDVPLVVGHEIVR